jgi:predicted nuclease with TOPRIM domain
MFIALLIIAPLAYIGAAYYNGQDPIANIKSWFGKDSGDTREVVDGSAEEMQDALEEKEDEIDKLKEENSTLRKEVDALKAEIAKLKGQ